MEIPIGITVFVKPEPLEKITKSGIIIPDTSKRKSNRGIVVDCGKGTDKKQMTLQKGDNVIFARGTGRKVIYNESELLMLKQSEIYGSY